MPSSQKNKDKNSQSGSFLSTSAAEKYNLEHGDPQLMEKYYASSRPHLSNSQIKAYQRSPLLFTKRYITKDTPPMSITDAMKRGSLVDHLITQPDVPHPYVPKSTADAKDHKPEHRMRTDMYEQAHAMADRVTNSKMFKTLTSTKHVFQYPLTSTIHDVPICGLADMVVFGPAAILIDIKTTQPSKINPRSWHYHCLDMGYYQQLALYKYMLREELDKRHPITTAHLIVSHKEDGYNPAAYYLIPEHLTDPHLQFAQSTIKEIAGHRDANSWPTSEPNIEPENLLELINVNY